MYLIFTICLRYWFHFFSRKRKKDALARLSLSLLLLLLLIRAARCGCLEVKRGGADLQQRLRYQGPGKARWSCTGTRDVQGSVALRIWGGVSRTRKSYVGMAGRVGPGREGESVRFFSLWVLQSRNTQQRFFYRKRALEG